MNGVDQGVAYRDLPLDTPLYGAVTLYKKDSQIVYNVRGSVDLYMSMRACVGIYMCVSNRANLVTCSCPCVRVCRRVWENIFLQVVDRFRTRYPWETE